MYERWLHLESPFFRWRSQDSVDTLFQGLVGGFELLRADATEVGYAGVSARFDDGCFSQA
jgi:hypothetical protein